MAKRLRCEAITKKGERCKNQSIGDLRCRVHTNEKKKKLAVIGNAVKVTTTTASAVKLIYEIVKFLIDHWPKINQFFHGIDFSWHISYLNNYKDECRFSIESSRTTEQQAHDLVAEFNSWFPTLPRDVQLMVIKKFGAVSIKRILREGTS